ncbi:MAG: hypothetical protein VX293_08980 [Candidatus Latescibacterota bacterium]|nr:hypothetical protein [Candidatus Latescibacterota bacterium]
MERRKHYNRIMKWTRRIHMDLGLFMIPWIPLYGITTSPTISTPAASGR